MEIRGVKSEDAFFLCSRKKLDRRIRLNMQIFMELIARVKLNKHS